jgi:1-acyl-sn-glycerol-3-phosphate acyltransferase
MSDEDAAQQNLLQRLIAWRVGAAMEPHPPNETLMRIQQPFVDLLDKYYFRVEVDGWERVPDTTCLVIGVHSGGALTMDAWTLVNAWQKHFGGRRPLHGTAHDVLMASPGLGDWFRAMGSSPRTERASERRWPAARTSSSGPAARSTRCAAGGSATSPC